MSWTVEEEAYDSGFSDGEDNKSCIKNPYEVNDPNYEIWEINYENGWHAGYAISDYQDE